MENNFFVGIIENRIDPLKLNRVQVRVFGVHTESLEDIPTEKLPWAVSISNFSAVSGKGFSGNQFVEGSAVFLFFQDGESKQLPIILGAYHGVPIDISPFKGVEQIVDDKLTINKITNSIEIAQAEIIDETGVPVDTSATTGTPLTPETKLIKEKEVSAKNSSDARKALKDALGKRESNNNYSAVNQYGYTGKYQMGSAYLADRGYMKPGVTQSKANMDNPDNWTGKDGIKSADDFKNNPAVQEKTMDAGLDANEKSLTRLGVIDSNSTEQEKAGYLATSHLLGTGGAKNMKDGKVGKDGNGVTGNTYYNLGYKAVAGKNPNVQPDKNSIDNPSREPSTNPNIGKTLAKSPVSRTDDVGINKTDVTAGGTEPIAISDLGFIDPNQVYPSYFNEQDTNRLSRNQNIDLTIVPIKEELEDKGVIKANGKGAWDQSPTPYNAKYPYNAVWESESGHIIEIDDTNNNERINIHHKKGTFIEIDRNGTMVRRIVGDSYEILDRDGFIHIKGNCNITVEGDANILVANNCELEVDGDLNANVGNNSNWSIGGDAKYTVRGDVYWDIAGNEHKTIKKSSNTKITNNINLNVDGDQLNTIGGKISVQSGGNEDHTNGGNNSTTTPGFFTSVLPVIGNASTSTSDIATSKQLPKPPRVSSGPISLSKLTLEPRGFEEISDFETDDLTEEEAKAVENKLQDAGYTDVSPIPADLDETKTQEVVKTVVEEKPVICGTFVSGKININQFISPNFRLKDLTSGAIPLEQGGLKDVELACNLKALAENVLEPIKKKYPKMIITSGLRPYSNNKKSQHPLGQAADLQFPGYASEEYAAIAKDIAGTVPFGQLILEYNTNRRMQGSPVTWIHVSYSSGGNKGETFTMNNHSMVKGSIGKFEVIK